MVCLFIMTMISILQIVFERTRNILDEDNLSLSTPPPVLFHPDVPVQHIYMQDHV